MSGRSISPLREDVVDSGVVAVVIVVSVVVVAVVAVVAVVVAVVVVVVVAVVAVVAVVISVVTVVVPVVSVVVVSSVVVVASAVVSDESVVIVNSSVTFVSGVFSPQLVSTRAVSKVIHIMIKKSFFKVLPPYIQSNCQKSRKADLRRCAYSHSPHKIFRRCFQSREKDMSQAEERRLFRG